mmetsp:Transcript_9819/g.20826  ORF Transcript_9819/g.20826 Transcript_9819/m.20826 type:complete len:223 (-) Transcript_9819:291-959(-)
MLAGQCFPEEAVHHRLHESALLVVRSAAMPALDVLVIISGRLCSGVITELGGHFSSVPRVHAIVLCRGGEEGGWVQGVLAHELIGRVLVQKVVPVLGLGIPILSHPTRSGQEAAVALHVQERHLAHHCSKELAAPPRKHVPHEEATVRAALDAELLPTGHPAGQEILCHGLEVLVGLATVFLQRRLVPAWPVLTSSPDVGFDPNAALLEPGRAARPRVERGK